MVSEAVVHLLASLGIPLKHSNLFPLDASRTITGAPHIKMVNPKIKLEAENLGGDETSVIFRDKNGVWRTFIYYTPTLHASFLGVSGLPLTFLGTYVGFNNLPTRQFAVPSGSYMATGIAGAMAIESGKLLFAYNDLDDVSVLLDDSDVLNSLADVNVGSPSNKDSLRWDDKTSKWIPEAVVTAPNSQVFSGLSPTSWTDLDLSGIIGARSALVMLAFKSAADMNAVAVRKNGDTEQYFDAGVDANAYGVALGHHDADAVMVLMCVTDPNGVIEWITETQQTCTVTLIACIK